MPRVWARAAGACYLVTIIAGVFAEAFVRGRLTVRDDAAATAANIAAHELLYRSGLIADLVMLAAYIVVTLLLYLLFKPFNRTISLLAAFFSLIGIAVLAANCLTHIAPLLLKMQPDLALLSLRLHARGYSIAGVFFGIYCLLIGHLAFDSRVLPRVIGVLMAVGGFGYLIDSFTFFLFPELSMRLPDFTILGGIAELVLALWLMIAGVKTNAEERAAGF